jgi:hypothetical protein
MVWRVGCTVSWNLDEFGHGRVGINLISERLFANLVGEMGLYAC